MWALMIADTDILIESMRGWEPAKERVARELRHSTLATTAIGVFKLGSGVRIEKDRERVDRLLRASMVLAFDEDPAAKAARLRRELEDKARSPGMADHLLAAVSSARSASLLAGNRDHFEPIPEPVLAPP